MSNEHNEKDKKKSGGVTIDSIDAAPLVQSEKSWVSIAKAFNPLGAATEAYAKALAYRLETKRLNAELERVKIQASVIHDALDKTFQLKMEELGQRRVELERFYDTVQGQLQLLHIERMQVLKMAEKASEMALAIETSPSERALFKEMAIECVAQLAHFGGKANESLEVIVKSLPSISMPERLLPTGD